MKNKIGIIITLLSIPIIFTSCKNSSIPTEINPKRQIVAKNKQIKENKNTIKTKDLNNSKKTAVNNTVPQDKPIESLDTKSISWYFMPNTKNTAPDINPIAHKLLKEYNGYYVGDTSSKIIYLTFDEGYENGYTNSFLDTLKNNNIKASFFVTTPYIKSQKALIKRMVNEGHLVGNHSTTHPSMPDISDKSKFDNELLTAAKSFKELTGKKISPFFRPPMGKYSERSMYYTSKLGYNTVFWSFAYADWDPKKQPDPNKAKNYILTHTHNGAIILLHAESKTNADILDFLIKEWKSKGYEFKTLDDLPKKQ